MNKFTRFTLFAGMMAIGLAACGDDVQVTPPPEPEPDPLEVSLTPGDAAIDVGETIVLSVNISGGEAGAATTITCTASNDAITVTTNQAAQTCSVTGVTEGGSATVNVVVTRGEQTNSDGAFIEVLEDTDVPATIVIEKVTQGTLATPVALNNVQRQVEVTVNIDPGTQILEEVTLFFRGDEIASQTLTPAQVAAMRADSPEAQALRVITFSWTTDAYVIDAGGGPIDGTGQVIVNHVNGLGALQAQVTVDDGTDSGTAVNSVPLDLTLRNLNGFHLDIDRTGSTNLANDVQGFQWRGGPDGVATGAGIDAHLLPVVYSRDPANPGVSLDLEEAQFSFRQPAGILINRTSADGSWTYSWTPALLAGYTMPAGVPGGIALPAAFPNLLRDGEYPTVVGNATLEDGQGMGPFGGALDCVGVPTGLLNVEVSATGLCTDGTAWNPPSATLVAGAVELDPLRVGERIDNAGPLGRTYVLASLPGTPDFPQVPNPGDAVNPVGVWINGHVDGAGDPAGPFHPGGAPGGYQFANAIGAAGGSPCAAVPAADRDPTGLWDLGVSRCVAGFGPPDFGDRLYEGSLDGGATWADMTANPTGSFFPESTTFNVYQARVTESDELMNGTTTLLAGAGGVTSNFGQESGRPILAHNVGSNPDRFSFDLLTVGAGAGGAGDDLTAPGDYVYNLAWQDPITTAASGFTAFGPNPIWRQIHQIVPGGPIVQIGGAGAALNAANYVAGPSIQPVTNNSQADGYYRWLSYLLDDAGNLGTADEDEDGAFEAGGADLPMGRQAAIANADSPADGPHAKPTVFGITAPVNMVGGSQVTFTSNASHGFDLGYGFLSLDYPIFNESIIAGWWAATSSAPAPNTPGGYYTPMATPAPAQGTTGGVRFQSDDFDLGTIFDESPFESVATLMPTATPFSHSIESFVRSIEYTCTGGGPHADCAAGPTEVNAGDFASFIVPGYALNGGHAAHFPAEGGAGAAADIAYANNRPSLASFSIYDATRPELVNHQHPGTSNFVLEQGAPVLAATATDTKPNRGVSTAAINPISVALNGGATPESAFDDLSTTHFAWGIFNTGSAGVSGGLPGNPNGRMLTITGATARLITLSSAAPGGPGQNIFAGPLGRVDFYVLEPATGTLRWGGMQNNPILNEGNVNCLDPSGAGATPAEYDDYRCWDFTATIQINNWVGGSLGLPDAQILAVGVANESAVAGPLAANGVTALGDGLATFPVDITIP